MTSLDHGHNGRFQARAGLLAVVGVVYAVACGGPYGTEDYVASTGPGLLLLLLFLAPWLWGVPVAFAIAELSSLLPIKGGYYGCLVNSIFLGRGAPGEHESSVAIFI